jgi:hypothetical protein
MIKNVKVKDIYRVELDKDKKYIFFLPKSDWSDKDARNFSENLSELGFGGITLLVGEPDKVKIIEQDKTIMEKLLEPKGGD